MKYNRQQATLEQIETATNLFVSERWASACTLLGAAEGMIPDINGKQDYLLAQINQKLTEKEIKFKDTNFNSIRDWLKHNGVKPECTVINELDCIIMWIRAKSKYDSYYGNTKNPKLDEFEAKIRNVYGALLSP